MSRDSLRLVRLANSVFSLLSGVLIILLRSQISEIIGLPSTTVMFAIGAGVAVFGGHLAFSARRQELNFLELRHFALMDGLWVLGSAAILLIVLIPVAGFWLVAGVGLIVIDFGILKLIGIRSMPNRERQSASSTRSCRLCSQSALLVDQRISALNT